MLIKGKGFLCSEMTADREACAIREGKHGGIVLKENRDCILK